MGMDEAHLTGQEIRDLIFLLLDAIDIAEGTAEASDTWAAQAFDQCQMLVDRLYEATD
jgi:hypothetical protein